jgi:hypothetical protein
MEVGKNLKNYLEICLSLDSLESRGQKYCYLEIDPKKQV